jgi:hypothetical protein
MILGKDSTFNDVKFSDYNLYVCDFDDGILKEVGIDFNRSVSINNEIKFNPTFSINDSDDYEIELNLILYNSAINEKLQWTDEILQRVYSWLITDDFKEFKTEGCDFSYYLMVTNIQKFFTIDRKGYLKVTFKSIGKYAYKKVIYEKTVTGQTTLVIENLSNEIYKPKIVIVNKGNSNTINRINQLEVTNMEKNEALIIDNLLCTVECNGENAFNKVTNRKWISLGKGENTISLDGNMKVEIICNFPIIL